MIFRHALLAAAITGLAGTAYAQTTPAPSPSSPPTSTPPAATPKPMATPDAADAKKPAATPTSPAATATESTGDFNVAGDVSANAVIGTKIHNENKDSIGAVQDLYLDSEGATKTVVVAVGGFLGVGAKEVAIKWSDLKQSRDGKSLVLTTSLSKDELKALPDYTAERRRPAAPDQAAAPRAPK